MFLFYRFIVDIKYCVHIVDSYCIIKEIEYLSVIIL